MIVKFIEDRLFKRKRSSTVIETLLIDLSAVFVWRGTWGLMDKYLFPNYPDFSFIFSIIVGATLILAIRQFNNR